MANIKNKDWQKQVVEENKSYYDEFVGIFFEEQRDEGWKDKAACRGMPSEFFFIEKHLQVSSTVKKLCSECPVNKECAEYGKNEKHGIWGGRSIRYRKRAIRNEIKRRIQNENL